MALGTRERKRERERERERRRGISALELTQVNAFYRGGNTCMHSCALYKMASQDEDDYYNMRKVCVYASECEGCGWMDGSIFPSPGVSKGLP